MHHYPRKSAKYLLKSLERRKHFLYSTNTRLLCSMYLKVITNIWPKWLIGPMDRVLTNLFKILFTLCMHKCTIINTFLFTYVLCMVYYSSSCSQRRAAIFRSCCGTGWRRFNLSCRMAKPTQWHVRPAKTQISLGISPVWSESSLSAWRNIRPLTIFWAQSEDSDKTWRMPRLSWVFAGRTRHWVGFVVLWLIYSFQDLCSFMGF